MDTPSSGSRQRWPGKDPQTRDTGAKRSRRGWVVAFFLGAAIGGISGWQAARHAGAGTDGISVPPAGSTASARRSGNARPAADDRIQRFVPTRDPAADLRRILAMRDAPARAGAFSQLLSTLKPDAVAGLLNSLLIYQNDQEQEDRIGGLQALVAARQIAIDHASAFEPAAVLTALAADPSGNLRTGPYSDVLRAWAARDPLAARSFFEQSVLTNKDIDARAVAGPLVRELVKEDAEGTFLWLRRLKADFVQEAAREALQTLSHYDGEKAGRLLASNKDLLDASDCVAAMAAGWARTEPEKALQWARGLPADISNEGIRTAAKAWSGKDFGAAIEAIGSLGDHQRAAALEGVVSATGLMHLKELLPMVEKLPESEDRAAAVGSLVGSWVDQSPEQAAAWLAASPEGASRDRGALVLALKTVNENPQSALEWASTVGAADQRRKAIDGLLEVWLKNDPRAARAWVSGTPRLSEDERSQLMERTGR